jgi:hypothetical protein
MSCLILLSMILLFTDVSEERIAFIHNAVRVSETSVNMSQATLRHIAEDKSPQSSPLTYYHGICLEGLRKTTKHV